MAKCMTIDEFHRLPEDVQEKYLTWSMEQFLRERHAILIERAGGVATIAKQLVEARALDFDYYMNGNYKSLRCVTSRRRISALFEICLAHRRMLSCPTKKSRSGTAFIAYHLDRLKKRVFSECYLILLYYINNKTLDL